MDELVPKYEEIENLLSSMPEQLRREMLGGMVSQSIYSQSCCFHRD